MINIIYLLIVHISGNIFDGDLKIRNCISSSMEQLNGGAMVKICTKCEEGYKIDSNKLCDECADGYIQDLTQENFTCKVYSCTNGQDHCETCNADGKSCSNCEEGYDVTANCMKCSVGFEQDKDSSEFKCKSITCSNGLRHCLECNKDGVNCDKCYPGFKASSDQVKVCDSCDKDYTEEKDGNDIKCVPICNVDKCISCAAPNLCGKCETGYMPKDYKCVVDCKTKLSFCDECDTIDDTTFKCYKCFMGYQLIDEKDCLALPYACSEGDAKEKTCTKCNSGYYLKSQACHPCPEEKHCSNCELVDGSTEVKCTGESCEIGYYMKENECLKCSITNCAACEIEPGNQEPSCFSCDRGYTLDENNNCKKCPDHFARCEEDYTVCEDGYYEKENTCTICPVIDNCLKCGIDTSIDANSPVCKICKEGFRPSDDGKSCVSCGVTHCTSCSVKQCDFCEDGYYTRGTSCYECPSLMNCLSCYFDPEMKRAVCQTCPEGYYFRNDLKSCELCSDHCMKCYPAVKDTICLECDSFSELNNEKCELKSCDVKGMEHCSKCQTDGTIKECILCDDQDYQIAEDKLSCEPKPCDATKIDNCVKCTIKNDQEICTECSEGYIISNDGKSCVEKIDEFPYKDLIENINDILNNGINKETFNKVFEPFEGFANTYKKYTDLLADTNLKIYQLIFEDPDDSKDQDSSSSSKRISFSSFFDKDKSLYDLLPDIKDYFEKNAKELEIITKIVSEVGPNLASALNLDFSTINRVYNYVVNNKNNGGDGIKIAKVLEYLGLPNNWMPNAQKVASNFDQPVPITTLFDGLDCRNEYNTFATNVKSLTIPEKSTDKFFSVNKVYDAVSSAVDLIRAVNNKFIQKYFNDLVMPAVNKYGLGPVNIFDLSINTRASSILKALDTIKGYANSCPKDEETKPDLKCSLYSSLNYMAGEYWCDDDEKYEQCLENGFSLLQNNIKKFTDSTLNLTSVLVNDFKVPPNYAQFIFGLMTSLTDSNKDYLDVLQCTSLLFSEDQTATILTYKDEPIQVIIKNFTAAVRFMSSIQDNSNFKDLFNYLSIPQYWDLIGHYIEQVDKNTLICNVIKEEPEDDYCDGLAKTIGGISEMLSTEENTVNGFLDQFLGETSVILTDIGIPALKTLNNKISQFLSNGYKAASPGLNDIFKLSIKTNENVNFDNAVTKGGTVFDKILSFIDESIPSAVKMLPIVGDLYPQIISKSRGFISVIKDNGQLSSLLDSCYDGIGVIVQMLANAAIVYKDENTKMVELVKGAKPTTFLDILKTAEAVNKLEKYGIKDLINSIKYDGSNARLLAASISLNDVVPVKTIADNSKDLSEGFKGDSLQMKTVAAGLGVEPSELKQSLSSAVKSIVSPPANVVKEVAKATGADSERIDQIMNGIKDIGSNPGNMNTETAIEPPKKKGGLSVGAIVGIVVGCVVVVGVAVFLGVYFGIIRKKKSNSSSEKQAGDEGDGKNDDL